MKHYCAEIFSWSGPTMKIFYQRNFIHVRLRKWRIMKGLCVFACVQCSSAFLRRTSLLQPRCAEKHTFLCQCALRGCIGGMRLVFPFLSLELPSPLLLAHLDSHKRLLEVVLWTKATLSGPVVRLYAADTAEPFPPRTAVRVTVCHYFCG